MSTHNVFDNNQCPCGPINDPIVDKLLGNAYQVVKYVAMNMPAIKVVSDEIASILAVYAKLKELSDIQAKIPELMEVQAALPHLEVLHTNLVQLLTLYTNIDELIKVATSIDDIHIITPHLQELAAVAANITEVVATGTNISKVIAVANSIASVNKLAPVVTEIDTLAQNIQALVNINTHLPKLLNIEHHLPDLLNIETPLSKLVINSFEALRRGYVNSGYTLVAGSFEDGAKVSNRMDVVLYEKTGQAYSFTGSIPHNVAPGSSPDTESGWVNQSETPVCFYPEAESTPASLQNKAKQYRTFQDCLAIGDRVADDTTAVQRALRSEKPVTATTNQGYKVTDTVESPADNMIIGEGVRSAIVCDKVPAGKPGLLITPAADNNTRNMIGTKNLHVLRGGGGHAVVVDVEQAGKRIGRYLCERSFFSTSGNNFYALAVSNHLNVADKFFLASFKNSTFEGGLLLDGVGDSIEILGCNFTGVNEALVFKQTTEDSPEAGGPSSVLLFQGNNTFADKGIYIMDARSPKLRDNNLECGNGPGTLNALICIQGLTKRITGAEVTGNTILHAPHAQTGVYLGATDGALIDNNTFGVAATGYSIVISADAKNTCVGINQFIPSGTGREVLDNGVGTKGVIKKATLQNSWANAQDYLEPASFIKDRNGFVHLSGSVANGTTTAETVLFTLPYAFTPTKRQYFTSFAQNANGDYVTVVIRVDPDGSVRLTDAPVGQSAIVNLSLSGISFLAPDAV